MMRRTMYICHSTPDNLTQYKTACQLVWQTWHTCVWLTFLFTAVEYEHYSDTSVASLRFLTTEQVLQDVYSFLEHLLQAGDLKNGQRVILFGAGYGGAIATWARYRFPDLIHGAVVSSATLEARYDMPCKSRRRGRTPPPVTVGHPKKRTESSLKLSVVQLFPYMVQMSISILCENCHRV